MKQVNIADKLRKLRTDARLSQAEFAKEAGITQNSVWKYESGKAEPTLSALVFYADKFQVTTDYLLGREEEPKGVQKNISKTDRALIDKYIEGATKKDGDIYKLLDKMFKEYVSDHEGEGR